MFFVPNLKNVFKSDVPFAPSFAEFTNNFFRDSPMHVVCRHKTSTKIVDSAPAIYIGQLVIPRNTEGASVPEDTYISMPGWFRVKLNSTMFLRWQLYWYLIVILIH